MDTDQVILCTFVDKSSKDKPTGHATMYNLKNGLSLSPVFKDIAAERACIGLLDGVIMNNSAHFLSFSPAYSTFQVSCFAKEKPVAKFFGHEKMSCIATHGGLAVAGTSNGSIFIWQVSTGALLKVLNKVHFQQISTLVLTREYLCSASVDGTVKVWDRHTLCSGDESIPRYSFAHHTTEVSAVKFGVVGGKRCRLFTCSHDGTALVYDMFDGALSAKFTFPSPCQSLAVDVAEMCLSVGCQDGVVYVLDLDSTSGEILANMAKFGHYSLKSSSCLKTLDASPVTSLCFSVDNTVLVSGCSDGTVRFWDCSSMQLIRQISGTGSVTNIVSLLRGPVTESNGRSKSFASFKRNIDIDSDMVLQLVKPIKPPTVNREIPSEVINPFHSKLKDINKELFDFIIQNAEINK